MLKKFKGKNDSPTNVPLGVKKGCSGAIPEVGLCNGHHFTSTLVRVQITKLLTGTYDPTRKSNSALRGSSIGSPGPLPSVFLNILILPGSNQHMHLEISGRANSALLYKRFICKHNRLHLQSEYMFEVYEHPTDMAAPPLYWTVRADVTTVSFPPTRFPSMGMIRDWRIIFPYSVLLPSSFTQ